MRLLLAAMVLVISASFAQAQTNTKICFTTTGTNCVPVSASNPFPVAATASIAGFQPGLAYANLTASASSGSVALPAGVTVLFQNTGTTAVSCTLGVGSATATANMNIIQPGSSLPFTVGSNTFGACIDQTGSVSNVVVLSGGSGLATGSGGGSSGGGGGAVTIASGGVALGAYAAGALASGSIAAGAQVDLLTMRGTKAPGTAAANSILNGAVYTAAGITLTDGQQAALQFDVSGNVNVNVKSATGVVKNTAYSAQTGSIVMGLVNTAAPTGGTDGNLDYPSLTLSRAQRIDNASIVGTVTDVNSGNLSAGTQRVTQATNSLAIPTWGHGATGAAAPSGAIQVGVTASGATGGFLRGLIACDNHVFKHITTATDTLAVQGVASQTVYICAWRSRAAGTATWFLENTASTNANCSSSNTQIIGVATEAVNTGEIFAPAFWNGLKNTSGNGLCINSTGTGGVDIDIWFTQF